MKKKLVSVLAVAAMATMLFTGCNSKEVANQEPQATSEGNATTEADATTTADATTAADAETTDGDAE